MRIFLIIFMLMAPVFAGPETKNIIPVSQDAVVPIMLPDPGLTPGSVDSSITVEQLKSPEFIKKVRNVPESLKKQVFIAYFGKVPEDRKNWEIDHLVPCCMGGRQDIKNLWPQSYVTKPWNAHVKDRLEVVLHHLVEAGKVPLATAQHDISTNWIEAYKKYVGPNPEEHDKDGDE
jgi:hypothetical protein